MINLAEGTHTHSNVIRIYVRDNAVHISIHLQNARYEQDIHIII